MVAVTMQQRASANGGGQVGQAKVGLMIKTGVSRRTSKTTEEILAALNKALQAHPECVGMTVRKLMRLDNAQGLANWDVEFVIEHGTTISAECKRVFISAKQGIQKHFDLAGGG
jgi:hypothetical protein